MSSVEDQGVALAESPSSRFTAVNEKDQPTIIVSMNGTNGNGAARRSPEERPKTQSMMPPPGQEKLSLSTTTSPPHREEWISPPNGERPQYQPSSSYTDPDLSHKRKRSTDTEQNSPPSANSYHSHGLPSSAKQVPQTAPSESDGPREESPRGHPQADSRDPYNADPQYRSYLTSAEENREAAPGSDLWHSRQYPQQTHISSDEHLGEVLQRASQNLDAQQRREYEQTSPAEDDRSANTSYSAYGTERRDIPTQGDPKKRKRNFSNRTKTGCMTCRRRKKKCDEARPECNNCLRGGFVCSGYQQRGQWPKPEQKPTPVPLQSKTDYDKTPYGPPAFNPPPPPNAQRREPLPGYRGQALRVDPHHGRRINIDEDQTPSSGMTSASTSSPEKNRLSAISFSQQTATPITASSSAYPDRNLKSPYDRIGPLHDLTRQDGRQDLETPQSAQSSNLPPLLHPQIHSDSPRANPQVAAQLALSNLASANRPRTQKEEMLSGRHYFPFDKELVLERERCSAACWRFNNCINPNNRVTPEERSKLFRDILHPRDHVVSPSEASPLAPVGRVGDNVVVEAPFTCDYGYNITIGQDVAIGKNCTVLDTCEVIIGDRCNIGPNVNIYTATLPVDPKKRLGSRGPNLGRKIVIGSDCWIGGGAIILPGRTIGKGSTVGAGSIVTRDVPPYTVVCGNPARVIRGLYE